MSLTEGTDGRCVMCGAWPGDEHDEIAHLVAKQQGYMVHGTYERSHLVGHGCPAEICKPEEGAPVLERVSAPAQQRDMAKLLVSAIQQGALQLRPFRHATDEDASFVTWLLTAPAGPNQMLLIGQLFDADGGRGWIPLDEYGRPAGMATGMVEAVGASAPTLTT